MKTIQQSRTRPGTSAWEATQIAIRKYHVSPRTGKVYNSRGEEVGSKNGNETRLTVRLENGRKYGLRLGKLIGYVAIGPEALRRGVSVIRSKDESYRGSNLKLRYNKLALRNLRRSQQAAA